MNLCDARKSPLFLLAYLDPGSGDAGLSALVIAGIVILGLVLLGLTIYVAVRLARRP